MRKALLKTTLSARYRKDFQSKMKTLEEYEAWFQRDPDSMTGEDMFYYCYLEGCSIWYEDDSGEIVRFINHWRIYYLDLCIHIIHGLIIHAIIIDHIIHWKRIIIILPLEI